MTSDASDNSWERYESEIMKERFILELTWALENEELSVMYDVFEEWVDLWVTWEEVCLKRESLELDASFEYLSG